MRVFAEPDPEQLDAMLTLEGRLRLPLGALDERGNCRRGSGLNWRMIRRRWGRSLLSAPSIRLGRATVLEPRSSAGRHGHDAAQLALGSEAVTLPT